MGKLSEQQNAPCPVHTVIECLADKWALHILYGLQGGPQRFSQLRRGIPGVSQKMLSRTLKRLERDGLVARGPLADSGGGLAYHMTSLGEEMGVPLKGLVVWAYDHADAILAARAAHDRAGEDTSPPDSSVLDADDRPDA